jgi:hypothetical protein
MQGASERALQRYSKYYCVASVTKMFKLKGVQTIHRSDTLNDDGHVIILLLYCIRGYVGPSGAAEVGGGLECSKLGNGIVSSNKIIY